MQGLLLPIIIAITNNPKRLDTSKRSTECNLLTREIKWIITEMSRVMDINTHTFWTELQANHLYMYHRCMGISTRQPPGILNRLTVYKRTPKIAEKTFDFVHQHNSGREKKTVFESSSSMNITYIYQLTFIHGQWWSMRLRNTTMIHSGREKNMIKIWTIFREKKIVNIPNASFTNAAMMCSGRTICLAPCANRPIFIGI